MNEAFGARALSLLLLAAPAADAARPGRGTPAAGRWLPEVSAELERLLASRGAGTPGYTPYDPPVAVFVLDDVSISGAAGEAVFRALVDRAAFKFPEGFWELIPVQYGRARVRAGWEGFRGQPREIWEKDAYYRIYRKAFLRCHESICRDYGPRRCAAWRARLLAGFAEDELRVLVRDILAEEMRRPLAEERAGDFPEDPDPVIVRRGLRMIPEMRDLYGRLLKRGFDVWLFSGSDQWSSEEMARVYGVHPGRVVGVRTQVADGRLTFGLLDPLPLGSGTAEARAMFIGRSPALAVGGEADAAMLAFGEGVRIVVAARQRGGLPARALFQPRFAPVREPQEWAPRTVAPDIDFLQ